MKKETKAKIWRSVIVAGVLVLLVLAIFLPLQLTGTLAKIRSPEALKEFILSGGIWSYLIFFAIQFLQVTFLPIPAVVTTVAGTLVFGPWITCGISFVAVMLASAFSFLLGRKIGKRIVVWVAGEKDYEKWAEKLGQGKYVFFLMMLFPVFPDDILCMIVGTTNMTWKFFLVTNFITRPIGIFSTCFLSSGIIPFTGWWIVLWGVLALACLVLFIVAYKYQPKIEAFVLNIAKKMEKEKKIIKEEGVDMKREDYIRTVENNFKEETRALMMAQIDNFYAVEAKKMKRKKYKLGSDVVLTKKHLMTGFKLDMDYLSLISKEGKICGDYAGIETKCGVKWAVSTWKFNKKLKLKDYVKQYSGMSVVYNDVYEIVPYGQLDAFVEKIRKKDHFMWEAESTREMRFLPNDVRQNENIALIFNVSDKVCDKLIENELQKSFMPQEIRLAGNLNERNKTRALMEKGFGERTAYILFGIPRNCIEGLFVGRKAEKNKKLLAKIKELFPDCYICNIDGKVIVE